MKVVFDIFVVVNFFFSFYFDRFEVVKRIVKFLEMGIFEIYVLWFGEFEFVLVLFRFFF